MNKMVAFSKFPSLFAHVLLSKTAHCSTSHLSKQSICTFLLASSLTFSPFHTANLLPTLPSLQLHLVRSCVNTRKTIRSQEAVKLHQERYMLQHVRTIFFQTIRLVALHDYQIMHYHYYYFMTLDTLFKPVPCKNYCPNWKELIKKINTSLPMWTHYSWILPFDLFSLLHMVLIISSHNRQNRTMQCQ